MASSDNNLSFQQQLDSLSDSVHNTLQKFMIPIDSKLATSRAELHNNTPIREASSPTAAPIQDNELFPSRSANSTLCPIKLDAPRFDGSYPSTWLFRIEAFFDFHGTPEDTRLQIVAFILEGRAAAWFQWACRNSLFPSWKAFLTTIPHRFGPSTYEDYEGSLSKLTQTGSVADFQAEFEELMNKVTDIFEPLLTNFFITCLQHNIRCELQFHRPSTLMEAFSMAWAYADRFENPSFPRRGFTPFSPTSHPLVGPNLA